MSLDDTNLTTKETVLNEPKQESDAPPATSELQVTEVELTPELSLVETQAVVIEIIEDLQTIKGEETYGSSSYELSVEQDIAPAYTVDSDFTPQTSVLQPYPPQEQQTDDFELLEIEGSASVNLFDTERAETVLEADELVDEQELEEELDKADIVTEESEGLETEGDKPVSKKKSGDEDFEDFEFMTEEDKHSDSFSIPEEPIVEEEELKEQKKKKKKSLKESKRDTKSRISEQSDYSSLHTCSPELLSSIAGDFSPLVHGRRPTLPSISSLALEEVEEEEEEEEEIEEEEKEKKEKQKMSAYDRSQLYIIHDKLTKEYQKEKLKNSFLLTRLADYYKKRKMYHVLYEGTLHPDAQKKYEKQLDDFESVNLLNTQELANIQQEIVELGQKCCSKETEAQICFAKLQKDERDVGNIIISSAGHEEKIIERYLKRQKIQLSNLKKIRLDYIKIRNKVAETQEALDALDNLGSNLRLIDYQEMKLDNRNLKDKLEEKELELTRVRRKCQNTMQILAHSREKASALHEDIGYLKERLEAVTDEFEDVREQVNDLKQERDYYRNSITQMKQQAGLLSKPKILKDMCRTIEEAEVLARNVDYVRRMCVAAGRKVKNLRTNMNSPRKMWDIQEKMAAKESVSSVETTTIYMGSDSSSELTINS